MTAPIPCQQCPDQQAWFQEYERLSPVVTSLIANIFAAQQQFSDQERAFAYCIVFDYSDPSRPPTFSSPRIPPPSGAVAALVSQYKSYDQLELMRKLIKSANLPIATS